MEWTRGPTIGRGSSAAVSLATSASGELFAVKSTDFFTSASLQKEKDLISRLCSPYVIKCLGSDTSCEKNHETYNLFLEYVSGGTLADLIKEHGGSLKEPAIGFYMKQLLKGLCYLHNNGVVHCDIKAQNLLIGEEVLKIADFGCAKLADDAKSGVSGTPAYMAPEVARGEEQGFEADVWAVGCTLIEMATGSNPWPEMRDPASALYRIGYSGEVPEFPRWLSDNAKDFLSKCLIKDMRKRWTVTELLEHPFMSLVGEEEVFTKKSPTSVMDQGFWDALEVPEFSANATMDLPSTSDSAAGRIRDLISDGLGSSFSDWAEEGDWVTVRANEVEEILEVVEHSDFVDEDYEEEIEALIAIDDSLFDYYNSDEVSSVSEQIIAFVSVSDAFVRDSATEDVLVLKIIDFQNISKELCVDSDLLLFQSFSFFISKR